MKSLNHNKLFPVEQRVRHTDYGFNKDPKLIIEKFEKISHTISILETNEDGYNILKILPQMDSSTN